MFFLGIDTSCYTTSCAVADEHGIIRYDERQLLSVPQGGRGLRQSEMVFEHIKNLPKVFPVGFCGFSAVAVSARPRPREDSYMPVFRAAESFGEAAARTAGAPLFRLTHQHAHIGAAMIGNELPEEFLALHVSGGTTDLLRVTQQGGIIGEIQGLGGTLDISAGQLIDRTGVHLGLGFPAGPALERLAGDAQPVVLKSVVRGLSPSFSGAEAEVCRRIAAGDSAEQIAAGVQQCAANTLEKLIRNARERTGVYPVLLFGGVMQNGYIRARLQHRLRGLIFAEKRYSPDNSCGLALQARNLFLSGKVGKDL